LSPCGSALAERLSVEKQSPKANKLLKCPDIRDREVKPSWYWLPILVREEEVRIRLDLIFVFANQFEPDTSNGTIEIGQCAHDFENKCSLRDDRIRIISEFRKPRRVGNGLCEAFELRTKPFALAV
jgi:hypothetical protein